MLITLTKIEVCVFIYLFNKYVLNVYKVLHGRDITVNKTGVVTEAMAVTV